VNLRTGSPTDAAIGDAVTRILAEPGFRAAAEILRAELAACTPMQTITRALENAGAARATAGGNPSARPIAYAGPHSR